jgi:L-rhamnose mutarotase
MYPRKPSPGLIRIKQHCRPFVHSINTSNKHPRKRISMQRFCLALDLVDDPELIKEYEQYHAKGSAWPEVTQHDIDAGILNIEIFRTGNRMFMILETDDAFTFEKKALFDATNPKIAEWEALMWKFQLPLPWAKDGEKWVLMKRIFKS